MRMSRRVTFASLLAILLAVSAGACRKDAMQEPPDPFRQPGIPPSPLPVRWIESPGAQGVVREHYYGPIDIEGVQFGADGQVTVATELFGELVIAQEGRPPSWTYEFTEYRFKRNKLTSTTRSTGKLAIDFVRGANGRMVWAYRLDGGASADKARTFVRFGEMLAPAYRRDIGETEALPLMRMEHIATTTRGRVAIGEDADTLLNFKVRLQRGEQLVVRLSAETGWSLKPETTGVLRRDSSIQEGDTSLLTLTADQPGWTDLSFDTPWGVRGFRIKVD